MFLLVFLSVSSIFSSNVPFLEVVFAVAADLLTLVVLFRSARLKTIPNKLVISLALSETLMVISSGFFLNVGLDSRRMAFRSRHLTVLRLF